VVAVVISLEFLVFLEGHLSLEIVRRGPNFSFSCLASAAGWKGAASAVRGEMEMKLI